MDSTNDEAAVIDSMSYCGYPVSSYQWNTVTVNNGFFYVELYKNGVTTTPVQVYNGRLVAAGSCFGSFTMHVGAPYNGTIEITPTTLTTPGQIYSAVFVSDSAQNSPQLMDPIPVTDGFTGTTTTTNGYLVPVPGIEWNLQTGNTTQVSSAITFANSNDSVGACVGWGYDPVANSTEHQACARMKRADFCGTGQGWTDPSGGFASTIDVQLWDNGGAVHANPGMPPNLTEALWTPNGATCVNPNALRVGNGGSLYQFDVNGVWYGQPFDAATTCGYALPPCTSFSTSWNMASSAPCQTWDSTGTVCLAIPQINIQ
jgi:hypothetical protein